MDTYNEQQAMLIFAEAARKAEAALAEGSLIDEAARKDEAAPAEASLTGEAALAEASLTDEAAQTPTSLSELEAMKASETQKMIEAQRTGIYKRLRIISNETECSLSRIERTIGASQGVLRRAVSHNRDFAARILSAILEEFPQYSGDWLLMGREPKLRPDLDAEVAAVHAAKQEAAMMANPDLTEQLTQVRDELDKERRLRRRAEEALADERTLRRRAEEALAEEQSRALAPDMVRMRVSPDSAEEMDGVSIPFYDIEASAGLGLPTHEGGSRPSEYIRIPFAREGDVALTVGGVSMTPVIWTGDILCVTPCQEPNRIRTGKVYVVATNEEIYVKQLTAISPSGLTLHSFNPAYGDIELPWNEVRQVYKVRGTLSYQRYM